jgi:hypothetical protein
MARHSNFPTLFDECKTISLSLLKKWCYLKPGECKSGNITWSRGQTKTGCISFTVNMLIVNPYLELNYKYNGNPVNYSLQIVSIPANIGRGKILYFLCPVTGKRCRKLYLIDERFLHRKAFTGCYYEKQTYSKRNRDLYRSFEMLNDTDKAYDTIYSKHFKKYYAGKPTKRYYKAMQGISRMSLKDAIEIEEMIYRK